VGARFTLTQKDLYWSSTDKGRKWKGDKEKISPRQSKSVKKINLTNLGKGIEVGHTLDTYGVSQTIKGGTKHPNFSSQKFNFN
jgi:fructose-1-phosphate kinase PfkB-like protein